MRDLGAAPEDRSVVGPAREAALEADRTGKGHEGICCGAALALTDGRIVSGKNSPLLHAASSLLLNSLKILAEIGATDWLDLCLVAAQDEDPAVRTAAIKCLGMSEDPSASRTIVNCLADESPEVRVQAAIALEELMPADALGPLKAALNDQDPWVRSAAVSAFSIQPGASPGDLSGFLDSDDLMMKTSVIDALGTMAARGHEEVLDILKDVYAEGGLEIKRSVCRILGGIQGPRVLDLLKEAVRDNDPGVRTFAVQALAERKEQEAVKILTETAESDTDKLVRETARTLLEIRQ